MGKSLKKEDCQKIVSIILARKEFERAKNLKKILKVLTSLEFLLILKLMKRFWPKCILKMIQKDFKSIDVD